MTDRAAFEAWWSATMNTQEMDLHRFAGDQYSCHETNRSWFAWQEAARQEREACIAAVMAKRIDDGFGGTLNWAFSEAIAAIRARSAASGDR